jgi:hypothetical protein
MPAGIPNAERQVNISQWFSAILIVTSDRGFGLLDVYQGIDRTYANCSSQHTYFMKVAQNHNFHLIGNIIDKDPIKF